MAVGVLGSALKPQIGWNCLHCCSQGCMDSHGNTFSQLWITQTSLKLIQVHLIQCFYIVLHVRANLDSSCSHLSGLSPSSICWHRESTALGMANHSTLPIHIIPFIVVSIQSELCQVVSPVSLVIDPHWTCQQPFLCSCSFCSSSSLPWLSHSSVLLPSQATGWWTSPAITDYVQLYYCHL